MSDAMSARSVVLYVPVIGVLLFPAALLFMRHTSPVFMCACPVVLLVVFIWNSCGVWPRRKQNWALLIAWMERKTGAE